jgi:hypothetical protein
LPVIAAAKEWLVFKTMAFKKLCTAPMTNMLISSSASDISKFTKAKQCVESTKRRKIDR